VQVTREHILRILKERDWATVDELSREIGLTPVTVRHHLDILRGDGLVAAPVVRRRNAPGRPQHVYTLTDTASSHFPKKYDDLASLLLREMRSRLSLAEMDQIMVTIGERIAEQAVLPPLGDFGSRLSAAVDFLNEQGYLVRWERADAGKYVLHVANCPYERVVADYEGVCAIDMALLTRLLGTTPTRVQSFARDDRQCTYELSSPGGGERP
jgi:predicted ArsR family transcriptional regulator